MPKIPPDDIMEAAVRAAGLGSIADIAQAIAAERERCAKIADDVASLQARGWEMNPRKDGCGGAIAASNTGVAIAASIRSPG